jgi:RNA-directed DNA polymerase
LKTTKPFEISKHDVVRAWELVKANKGAPGVDGVTIEPFESNLKGNLYKLWSRMSSGTYFPPAVKTVAIPKKTGGERKLGKPTVSDRVAQMVAKLYFEPLVEPHFHVDSYGYRPNKSAHMALEITRKRCWRHNWVFEFDIKGLFDNIDHQLLMKAVKKHTDNRWLLLYIERWLTGPIQCEDGSTVNRKRGVRQGGVISPVLSNLFMHYAFDKWMERHFSGKLFCRYADDGLVHCHSEADAKMVKDALANRLQECGLEMHPEKTRLVTVKTMTGKRNTLSRVLTSWITLFAQGGRKTSGVSSSLTSVRR